MNTAETTETRAHHPYSPSTLQHLEVCPCYRSKQTVKPHERTVAGSRAHAVVDTGEDDARLSDEDAAAAAECLDFVERQRLLMQEEADRAYIAAQESGFNPVREWFQITELKETKLAIDDEVFDDCESTTSGYVDNVLINYTRTFAVMMDWKFGRWPVTEAKNNLQGIAYALGLFRAYPTLETIKFIFKQPHLDHISEAVFTRAQIPELYLRVQTVVARARLARQTGDFATAAPHVPVCNFCANIGRCPKVCEFACKVGKKFHPVAFPEDITPTMVHTSANSSLGLRLATVVKIWADAFRKEITERIIRGEAPLPEGQVLHSTSKRQLVDQAKLREIALTYMTQQEYESTLETTFGALEELVSEKAPRGLKKTTVESFQKALLDSGAVVKQPPFTFLKTVPSKEA